MDAQNSLVVIGFVEVGRGRLTILLAVLGLALFVILCLPSLWHWGGVPRAPPDAEGILLFWLGCSLHPLCSCASLFSDIGMESHPGPPGVGVMVYSSGWADACTLCGSMLPYSLVLGVGLHTMPPGAAGWGYSSDWAGTCASLLSGISGRVPRWAPLRSREGILLAGVGPELFCDSVPPLSLALVAPVVALLALIWAADVITRWADFGGS